MVKRRLTTVVTLAITVRTWVRRPIWLNKCCGAGSALIADSRTGRGRAIWHARFPILSTPVRIRRTDTRSSVTSLQTARGIRGRRSHGAGVYGPRDCCAFHSGKGGAFQGAPGGSGCAGWRMGGERNMAIRPHSGRRDGRAAPTPRRIAGLKRVLVEASARAGATLGRVVLIGRVASFWALSRTFGGRGLVGGGIGADSRYEGGDGGCQWVAVHRRPASQLLGVIRRQRRQLARPPGARRGGVRDRVGRSDLPQVAVSRRGSALCREALGEGLRERHWAIQGPGWRP